MTRGRDKRSSGADRAEVEQVVREVFEQHVPFNRVLELEVESLGPGPVTIRFPFRDDMVGNYVRRSLHGGVTSAVLDTVGGLAVFVDLLDRLGDVPNEKRVERLGRVGTIDLRIDYLRSATGESFRATARLLRSGSKVAVTRMELHSGDDDTLLAVGTGTYIVG